MPFLFVLYATAYIDRVNVGFAGLDMTKDLGFSNEVFGFGSGIFFFGYCLLQIPGAMLAEVWSARKWITCIMILWGSLAGLTGTIHTAGQFAVIRFLLGVAEGGFFPAVVIYLTHWYREADRGKAIGMFMAAIPLSNAVGASVAGLLLRLHWFSIPGWRWLLILEGAPALLGGVAAFFYLPERPKDVRWLSVEERDWLTAALEREQSRKRAEQQSKPSILAALRHPAVLGVAASYFLVNCGGYGLTIWLPKIAQAVSGLDAMGVSLVVAIPWAVAIPAMVLNGWHSDRTGDRRWHAAVAALLFGAALAISQQFSMYPAIAFMAVTLAAAGDMAYFPPMLALPTELMSQGRAAASFGFINLTANLGGFAGPYAVGFLTDLTKSYSAGVYLMVATAIAGSAVAACLRQKDKVTLGTRSVIATGNS
ncbi:MAG TPA: MFS transporter [Bryobacteraceae bacterium]|nr:MFS transporter [Bryobacteraceae bacterium]